MPEASVPPRIAAEGMVTFTIGEHADLGAGGWQFLVKFRAGGMCERCPAPGTISHHKDRNRENNTLANGEFLCRVCHLDEHRIWEHGNRVAPPDWTGRKHTAEARANMSAAQRRSYAEGRRTKMTGSRKCEEGCMCGRHKR